MANEDNALVPTFRVNTFPNEAASKAAGRPVFQEMEVCEIRFPGNRQTVAVFPAHDPEPNATRERGEVVTYAMLYGDQYRKFKSMETQDVSGTPLSELPFLTEAKRRELKALNVHTAEHLAGLDGQPLKMLGMGGREMKNQAQAYLDNARGSADVTSLAAQVAALQQQIKERDELIETYAKPVSKNKYQRAVERSVAKQAEADAADAEDATADDSAAQPDDGEHKSLDQLSDAELKQYIKDETGQAVKGNPSRETLIDRAMEIATQPGKDD